MQNKYTDRLPTTIQGPFIEGQMGNEKDFPPTIPRSRKHPPFAIPKPKECSRDQEISLPRDPLKPPNNQTRLECLAAPWYFTQLLVLGGQLAVGFSLEENGRRYHAALKPNAAGSAQKENGRRDLAALKLHTAGSAQKENGRRDFAALKLHAAGSAQK